MYGFSQYFGRGGETIVDSKFLERCFLVEKSVLCFSSSSLASTTRTLANTTSFTLFYCRGVLTLLMLAESVSLMRTKTTLTVVVVVVFASCDGFEIGGCLHIWVYLENVTLIICFKNARSDSTHQPYKPKFLSRSVWLKSIGFAF